jgi:hypothetical protein
MCRPERIAELVVPGRSVYAWSRAAGRREARSGPRCRVRWSDGLGLRRESHHHHDSDRLGTGTPDSAD